MASLTEDLLDFRWTQLHPDGREPSKAYADIGWDFRCVEDEHFKYLYGDNENKCIELSSGSRYTFSTGVAIELPSGYHGILKPRSGLAVKHGLDVLAGVIDNGYRGEIKICLQNNGAKTVKICAGDKIAQMIVVQECEGLFTNVARLSDTERGDKGFGSSGQ